MIDRVFYRHLLLAGAAGALTACATPTTGDYGDAPDGAPTGYPGLFAQIGQFPTLEASGGAVALDIGQATLGPAASAEQDANDTGDPDGQPNLNPSNTDADDGLVDLVVILTSIPPTASMAINVTGAAGGTGGTFFVNVLIDMNMNGVWDGVIAPGVNEWAVINFPVTVAPGVAQDVRLPAFLFANGNRLPDGAWMRIALTNEAMAPGTIWTGGGSFAAGEIEDHVIDLPTVGDPPKTCMPLMVCPGTVLLPRDGNLRQFACTIRNAASEPCSARYTLNRQPGEPASVAVTRVAPMGGDVCAPNGPDPVVCTGPINNPGRALTFQARKTGNLPVDWAYTATAVDPPAIIEDWGVIVGFGDSTGVVRFEDEPAEDYERGRDEPRGEQREDKPQP